MGHLILGTPLSILPSLLLAIRFLPLTPPHFDATLSILSRVLLRLSVRLVRHRRVERVKGCGWYGLSLPSVEV